MRNYKTDQELVGSDSCAIGISFRLLSIPSVDAQLAGNGDGTAPGGGIGIIHTSTGGLQGYLVSGSGLILSPEYAFSSGQIGHDFTAALVADSVNTELRLYIDGVEEGTATTYDGVYVTSTQGFSVGSYYDDASNLATSVRLMGFAVSSSAPDDAAAEAWHLSCAGSETGMSGFTVDPNLYFQCQSLYQLPPSWTSADSSLTLSRNDVTGTLSLVGIDQADKDFVLAQPAITSSPVLYTNPSASYSYDADATGGGVLWSLEDGPSGMVIDSATGEVTWTVDGTPGSDSITIRATNSYGFDEQTYTLSWQNAPVITSTGSTSATENVPYSYDGDDTAAATAAGTLVWSVFDADGTTFAINSSSGLVTWTPDPADVGSKTIISRATDEYGFDDETINITVAVASTFTLVGLRPLGSNYTKRSPTGSNHLLGSGTMTHGLSCHIPSGLANGLRFLSGMGIVDTYKGYMFGLDVTSDGAVVNLIVQAGDTGTASNLELVFLIPELGKHYTFLHTIGGGTQTLYVCGAFDSSQSFSGSFAPIDGPDGEKRYSNCGNRGASQGCTGVAIFGSVFLNGVAENSTNAAAWHAACKASDNGIADLPSGAAGLWDAADFSGDCTTQPWPATIGDSTYDLADAGGSTCDTPTIEAEFFEP